MSANSKTETLVWQLSGCVNPGSRVSHITIDKSPFRVGRRSEMDLTLGSNHVSGRHAEFIVAADSLFIRDLESSNGTFVNAIQLSGECPIGDGDRIQFADREFIVSCAAIQPEFEIDYRGTVDLDNAQSLWIFSQFERLVGSGGICPAFQVIVDLNDGMVVGYEALARSIVSGLEQPDTMFHVANRLAREEELSIICRERAVSHFVQYPMSVPLFVNTHPAESFADHLIPSLRRIRQAEPDLPLTVEIHECVVTCVDSVAAFAEELTNLNIKLAYDDFGAGQARLLELVAVPPDFVKLDAALVRDIQDASAGKLTMIRGLIETAKTVGSKTIAEGIETRAEADVCRELGVDLVQGYLFGRPATLTL